MVQIYSCDASVSDNWTIGKNYSYRFFFLLQINDVDPPDIFPPSGQAQSSVKQLAVYLTLLPPFLSPPPLPANHPTMTTTTTTTTSKWPEKLQTYLRPYYTTTHSLIHNPSHTPWLIPLLLTLDLLLSTFIILRIPYTEIDWKAYMQQIAQYRAGERDYTKIRGDTGPLVYGAGHVWIYNVLYVVTDQGRDVRLGQWIFMGVYLLGGGVVMACAREAKVSLDELQVFVSLAGGGEAVEHTEGRGEGE